jgi:hypothetical protein
MSTNENTPSHIWIHNVETAAIAKGANAETLRELRPMLLRWYAAGEPVDMAVQGIVPTAKRRLLEQRAEASDGRATLRAAYRAARR